MRKLGAWDQPQRLGKADGMIERVELSHPWFSQVRKVVLCYTLLFGLSNKGCFDTLESTSPAVALSLPASYKKGAISFSGRLVILEK
jgi:hypothetical protein